MSQVKEKLPQRRTRQASSRVQEGVGGWMWKLNDVRVRVETSDIGGFRRQ